MGLSTTWRRRARQALACAAAAFAVTLAAAPAAQAQLADPRVDWSSADSTHFRVHYRSSQRAQAEQVARVAERVLPRVAAALQWQPRSRTEIVLYNEFDVANGFSTPLPFNMVGLFLAPPDEGELLDNSPWLELLLVHELTHTVHLDKVRGAPRVLQSIFGRVAWFMPNLFLPGWMAEGLATWHESDPAAGRGRLRGPVFEAWLRAERERGFLKLAEINSDGRALPLAKQYLYGAYFVEFLARRYGIDKPYASVEAYSGNIVPRLHTNPHEATGKTMDLLWDEFLADLDRQVRERAAPIVAEPEVAGRRLLGPLFEIGAVAALPDGATLAVIDDGLRAPALERVAADGRRERLARVNAGTRLDVAADGRVLVAQPEVCDTLYYAFDLYRLEGTRLVRLTHCAHLRRGVQAAGGLYALQLDGGRTRLVRLDADGGGLQVLHAPADDTELVDLAAAHDGRTLHLATRRGGDWQLLAFDLSRPGEAPRVVVRGRAPMQGLRHGAAGLELLLGADGQQNVWRLQGDTLVRLTHAHTAVVAQGGSAADGALATVVIAPQGYELRRLESARALQSRPALAPADGSTVAAAPVAASTPAATAPLRAELASAGARDAGAGPVLGEASRYSALRALYPRSWLPAFTADRGLTAYGASTSGGDALGWHQYLALLQWETSQKEAIGELEYVFLGNHLLSLSRSLSAREWTGGSGDEKITVYDRNLQLQWLSLMPIGPLTRLEQRVRFGGGVALDRVERVRVSPAGTTRRQDERVAGLVLDIDTRAGNWFSDGPSRGFRLTLVGESYRPFTPDRNDAATDYDGDVVRADLRALLAVGRGVLALRYTEARARRLTEPFQLGGATEPRSTLGPVLNSREIALRGYRGDEPELLGRNARVASLEARWPLADIDRHGMVPPFGINRLSGTAFVDVGGAWDQGGGPSRYRRGVGVELHGELKLLYSLGLDLRAGVARALDEPRGTRGYLALGRAF